MTYKRKLHDIKQKQQMSTILNGVIEVYDEYAESWFFVIDTFQIFNQDYDIRNVTSEMKHTCFRSVRRQYFLF